VVAAGEQGDKIPVLCNWAIGNWVIENAQLPNYQLLNYQLPNYPMFQLTASPGLSRRIVHLLALSILAIGVVIAINSDAFGPFLLVLTIGAAIGGLLMLTLVRHTDPSPEISVSDSFQRDALGTHVIDVSRIRVAGFGGLGLMAMAVALGFAIPRVGVSLALGLIGGFFVSVAIAAYRRRHAGRWP
jgi:hypothetical protein